MTAPGAEGRMRACCALAVLAARGVKRMRCAVRGGCLFGAYVKTDLVMGAGCEGGGFAKPRAAICVFPKI